MGAPTNANYRVVSLANMLDIGGGTPLYLTFVSALKCNVFARQGTLVYLGLIDLGFDHWCDNSA